MRRTILLCSIALLAASAANYASAQRHGGGGPGIARRGYGLSRARGAYPYGFGYPYLPYDSGAAYGDAPEPAFFVQRPPFVEPPAPPVVEPLQGHAVILEYKWPAAPASAPSTTPEQEPQTFAIVLKDGSTLSAVTVYASDDGLHYVDPDEKHLRIAMSQIDRTATLKVNRAKNLTSIER